MKRGNIFGIQPKQPGALQIIVSELTRILTNPSLSESQIEVQIKYAEFKYFSPPQYGEILNRAIDVKQKKKLQNMAGIVQRQRYFFKDTLKKLSHQQLVYLNPLGRQIYQLNSCFDQQRYRKFYQMRQYLIRQCQFNENFKSKNILLPQSPKNIYHQYSLIGDNLQFQMQTTGEIRFDLIYKDLSSPLNGRYSYSNLSKSWIKTKKTQLIKEQIDVMLSEKTFRFAVNNEDETEVCFQDLEALKEELIKRKFKQVDIRLKRTLKCTKGNIIQYSLSEVFEPQKKQGNLQAFDDLQKFIAQDSDVLDVYLIQKFQQFYINRKPQQYVQVTKAETRFEVECEFTQQGVKLLRQYAQKRQFKQMHYELQESIQSLYNLFFADHSVRTHEATWLDKIINSKDEMSQYQQTVYPNHRLVNQFGSYMHNLLYEEMTFVKNP